MRAQRTKIRVILALVVVVAYVVLAALDVKPTVVGPAATILISLIFFLPLPGGDRQTEPAGDSAPKAP